MITAPVVGNYYATHQAQQLHKNIVRHPAVKQRLTLVFEPGNKFDVNAVAVYSDKTMLGHVDRSSAARIADLVHQTLGDEGVSRLEKVNYNLLAETKVVGDRVYATIIGCNRIIK